MCASLTPSACTYAVQLAVHCKLLQSARSCSQSSHATCLALEGTHTHTHRSHPHSVVLWLQVTDQKLAMEMLLSSLGITAKTNFIHIKGVFDRMDQDGSGDVDGDELACAPLLLKMLSLINNMMCFSVLMDCSVDTNFSCNCSKGFQMLSESSDNGSVLALSLYDEVGNMGLASMCARSHSRALTL